MEHHSNNTEPERDRLVPFPEALSMLGVSKSTAYRMLARHGLPEPVKIGSRTFFSERELLGWIAEKLASRSQEGRNV